MIDCLWLEYYHIDMKNYTYRVIIEPDGKYFHGYVPALPGCHTYGKNLNETKKNLNEAISLYVESLMEEKKKVPEDSSFESFETVILPATT